MEDQIFVKIDKARMEFVIQVLFENALAYTPTGKNVEVTVGHSGRKAFISVTDHGIGMDHKTISRLFTEFFRADNAKRVDTDGFGVGLYLAKSVVRRHKGKLEAFSDGLNAGSTFVVTLKRVK
jgi:signal transduction histidine kinase